MEGHIYDLTPVMPIKHAYNDFSYYLKLMPVG